MKKNIRLNEKEVRSIQVNKEKKLVTVVSDDIVAMSRNALGKVVNMMREEEGKKPLEYEPLPTKVVTISNPVKNDEFDPYIGVALALAYNLFGSKTKFRKYVKEEILKEKDEPKKLPSFKELEEKYSLQQLRDIAKSTGLTGYTRMRKSDLVKELYQILIVR